RRHRGGHRPPLAQARRPGRPALGGGRRRGGGRADPDRTLHRPARRRPRRAPDRPAVVLPTPAGPPRPRARGADAPHRPRGRPRAGQTPPPTPGRGPAMTAPRYRFLSLGAGVQSSTVLVLACQG